MREIDFRMWDSTTKKYFYDPINVFDCLKHQSLFDKKLGFLAFNHIAGGRVFEQYTGLNDKNGDKIFEGDIVNITARPPGTGEKMNFSAVVRWDCGDCGFFFETSSDVWPHNKPWFVTKIEVVGNLNEDPGMVPL